MRNHEKQRYMSLLTIVDVVHDVADGGSDLPAREWQRAGEQGSLKAAEESRSYHHKTTLSSVLLTTGGRASYASWSLSFLQQEKTF